MNPYFHDQTLLVPRGSLHVARGPDSGPPLVLLHGVARSWKDWSLLFPHLLARWQVHALDFRGHGDSSPMMEKYQVRDYVEDGRNLLSRLSEPAVVYGHSLGAMVALALAADPGLHVKAVILEDPPFHTMGENIRQTGFFDFFSGMEKLVRKKIPVRDLARELGEIKMTTPDGKLVYVREVRDATAIRFSARCLTLLDANVFAPILAGTWLEGYDLENLLSTVRCPMLVLQGDIGAGGMLQEEDVQMIAGIIEDLSLVKFPGVGHLIHWQCWQETMKLVTGFLESL